MKIRGFNQWDEEWETGTIDSTTGQNNDNNNQVRSKNYIQVLPDTTYYAKLDSTISYIYIFQYDINKNWLGASRTINVANNVFNTHSKCAFIRFRTSNVDGTIPDNSICINISSSLNGTYKPYTETTISVPQTELLSAGSVHNNIQVVEGSVVEGEQLYNLVFNKLVDEIDLSNINDWTLYNGKWIGSLILSKPSSGADSIPNIICDKYIPNTPRIIANETTKGITIGNTGWWGNGKVAIYDDSITSSSQITGTLNYELATPTQTVIATDLHFDEVSSLIEQGGTIEMINSGTPTNTTTTFVVKKAVGE